VSTLQNSFSQGPEFQLIDSSLSRSR